MPAEDRGDPAGSQPVPSGAGKTFGVAANVQCARRGFSQKWKRVFKVSCLISSFIELISLFAHLAHCMDVCATSLIAYCDMQESAAMSHNVTQSKSAPKWLRHG